MTRRRLCATCATLVDVTGLVADDSGERDDVYHCRVATACAVRAARKLRTAPRDATAPHDADSVVQGCRFCGTVLIAAYSLHSAAGYECRHAGACERRMSRRER